MCAKNKTIIYVARTSNNRVISLGDLYCCLLPQCEALHICRSGFWSQQNGAVTRMWRSCEFSLHTENAQSVWFVVKSTGCCCNLSGGVVLIMWFTTNGMCVKNKTIIYVARASNSKRLRAWSLLLLAATVRSFVHMPLGISDGNNMKTVIEKVYIALFMQLSIHILYRTVLVQLQMVQSGISKLSKTLFSSDQCHCIIIFLPVNVKLHSTRLPLKISSFKYSILTKYTY